MVPMQIILATVVQNDLQILYEKINTYDVVKDCNRYHHVTWDEHIKWFNDVSNDKSCVLFGIYNAVDFTMVGTCYLKDIDHNTKTAVLGVRVWEPNKGVGTSTVKRLIDYAKDILHLSRVYLTVFSTNPVAIHVYKKCGFKMDKIVEKDTCINGRRLDILRMCLDLEDA